MQEKSSVSSVNPRLKAENCTCIEILGMLAVADCASMLSPLFFSFYKLYTSHPWRAADPHPGTLSFRFKHKHSELI
jgi:hypothetical protein